VPHPVAPDGFEGGAASSAGHGCRRCRRRARARRAEALGILDEVGTTEVGKRADLVVVTNDPSRDVRNTLKIQHVILGGTIVTTP